jgi:hypothetical protein
LSGQVVHLECCCCGGDAGNWQQWWNRDDGYGCCARCVEDMLKQGSPQEEIDLNYGKAGLHREAAPSEPPRFRVGLRFKVPWPKTDEERTRFAQTIAEQGHGALTAIGVDPKEYCPCWAEQDGDETIVYFRAVPAGEQPVALFGGKDER